MTLAVVSSILGSDYLTSLKLLASTSSRLCIQAVVELVRRRFRVATV